MVTLLGLETEMCVCVGHAARLWRRRVAGAGHQVMASTSAANSFTHSHAHAVHGLRSVQAASAGRRVLFAPCWLLAHAASAAFPVTWQRLRAMPRCLLAGLAAVRTAWQTVGPRRARHA